MVTNAKAYVAAGLAILFAFGALVGAIGWGVSAIYADGKAAGVLEAQEACQKAAEQRRKQTAKDRADQEAKDAAEKAAIEADLKASRDRNADLEKQLLTSRRDAAIARQKSQGETNEALNLDGLAGCTSGDRVSKRVDDALSAFRDRHGH